MALLEKACAVVTAAVIAFIVLIPPLPSTRRRRRRVQAQVDRLAPILDVQAGQAVTLCDFPIILPDSPTLWCCRRRGHPGDCAVSAGVLHALNVAVPPM